MRYSRLFKALRVIAIKAGFRLAKATVRGAMVGLSAVGLLALAVPGIDDESLALLQRTGLGLGLFVLIVLVAWEGWGWVYEHWKRAWWMWRVHPAKLLDIGRHEAGHALLGIALGLPYKGITLEQSAEVDHGFAHFRGTPGAVEMDPLDAARRLIAALEAGKAAERTRRLNGGYLHDVTDDQHRAHGVDDLLDMLGHEKVRKRAIDAVEKLFKEQKWRKALDQVAKVAARQRSVDKATLESVVRNFELRDGIEEWAKGLAGSQPLGKSRAMPL